MKKKQIKTTNELIEYIQNDLKTPLNFSERHDIRFDVKTGRRTIQDVISEYEISETLYESPDTEV